MPKTKTKPRPKLASLKQPEEQVIVVVVIVVVEVVVVKGQLKTTKLTRNQLGKSQLVQKNVSKFSYVLMLENKVNSFRTCPYLHASISSLEQKREQIARTTTIRRTIPKKKTEKQYRNKTKFLRYKMLFQLHFLIEKEIKDF